MSVDTVLSRDVLLIASMEGLENCGQAVESLVGSHVECAQGRRAGLQALKRVPFGVVVVEESLAEGDPEWADLVWDSLGMAMPIRVNFAISGTARLARDIRTALARRDGEQLIAQKAAANELANDFKSSLTGLLLQSELALREPAMPAALEPKLRHLVELAGAIRERLEHRRT